MKAFFIILFILSSGQLAANSGTSGEDGFLPLWKGGFCSRPDNRSIPSPQYLFSFDAIKREMQKSTSGSVYPDAASDPFTARFYDQSGESRISSYNGNGQNLSDQSITDLQTSVYISRLPAWASFSCYGKSMILAADKLKNEKCHFILNSKLK